MKLPFLCALGLLAQAALAGAGAATPKPAVCPPASAPWPAKVFAPYAFIPTNFIKITECQAETQQKYFTLAFIICDREGQPAWNGERDQRMDSGYYADQINAIRAKGGDVMISFGGEGGSELALKTDDAVALQAKYQSVIDAYHVNWLDFDIEGKALGNTAANGRRNLAIKGLQAKNSGLKIAFTLPVSPRGLEKESLVMLKDAKKMGVVIESVNIMTMDYGKQDSKGKKMGDLALSAAKGAYAQTQRIDPAIKIGITPMIGVNDVKTEIFSLDDARAVMEFSQKTPWVRSVGFWASNRDQENSTKKKQDENWYSGIQQGKWAFTNIFKPLSAEAPADKSAEKK